MPHASQANPRYGFKLPYSTRFSPCSSNGAGQTEELFNNALSLPTYSSLGAPNTTPTQRMKKIIITCSLLLSAVFSSQAATTYPTDAASSTYHSYYQAYCNPSTANFWVSVTQMGSNSVSNGLGIFNKDTEQNINLVSETMGYAMIVAALYDDQVTFDRLSATVQAGILSGVTPGNVNTGLLPWTWTQTSNGTFVLQSGESSASDGDINIALAYIYADNAFTVYGWTNKPTQGSSLTYKQMATNYIQAIRTRDFATSASPTANQFILTDGSDQAASGGIYSWHPDYSDIRAYQLFSTYDSATFWQSAISYTKEAWKAVFDFGSADTRTTWTTQPPTGTDIQASKYNTFLSGATYVNLTFASSYSNVLASRTGTVYDSDSCRMPIRLMNFINASENNDASMTGIANSILTALGSTYTTNNPQLVSNIKIWTPFAQDGDPNNTQDFIAGGLLALAGDSNLTYANRATVAQNLVTAFGNGMNGTIQDALTSGDGFNDSLTLWGLTVYSGGNTPLQEYIEGLKSGIGTTTNSVSSSPTTPASITSGSTVAEVKAIVSSRIQTALAAPGSAPKRSLTDTATILGVSKSNLSKALNLAPTGVKTSNGKVNLSKFSKFISRNSKAATLLAGKSKAKGKKTSDK
jgi:endo-1,4-beta-D-glucanase Y